MRRAIIVLALAALTVAAIATAQPATKQFRLDFEGAAGVDGGAAGNDTAGEHWPDEHDDDARRPNRRPAWASATVSDRARAARAIRIFMSESLRRISGYH